MPETLVTKEHIERLANELARAAGITPEQALKVLDAMHVNKLNENMVAHRAIMSDQKAVNALGMSQNAARDALELSSPDMLKLANLRVAIKPMGHAGIVV